MKNPRKPKVINKDCLKNLDSFTKDEQKDLINLAIKDKILFYVIIGNGTPLAIGSGDVDRIRFNHPKKVRLNYQDPFATFPTFDQFLPEEYHNWRSIWVNEDEAMKLLNETRSKTQNVQNHSLQYSTPSLQILFKAVEKFWANHDKNNPPKKEIIVAWLLSQPGITKRVALAIDTIIRAPAFRYGGNRSRKT